MLDSVAATGIGSWPGTDIREALRVIRGELAGSVPEGAAGMPYLPELPDRGPGGDMIGRTAQLLVDLPVDLQPQGWRLIDRPGRDAERTAAFWRQDLDELAEAFDGYEGPLKLQVTGPWTLAAALWLPRGDRVLNDPGATRDLTDSLTEGVADHLRQVQELLPRAGLTLQLDEPSLAAVLGGRIRSDSGFRTLAAPEAGEAAAALKRVLGGVSTVVHCCASDLPLGLLRQVRPDALALDVTRLSTPHWEEIAAALDDGIALWAGAFPTDAEPTAYPEALDRLVTRWSEVGLPAAQLAGLTLTPACGLAGAAPEHARAATAATVTAAARLAEVAAG